MASHLGGTRNPMAIRWPAKIKPDAVPRDQFLHCNDVVPTIHGSPWNRPPQTVNGEPQMPIAGASFAATLTDRTAAGGKKRSTSRSHGQPRHLSRGLVGRCRRSRSCHGVPGLPQAWPPGRRRGRLGAVQPRRDWSQAHDLAAEQPKARPDARGSSWWSCEEQGAPGRRRPVGACLPPRVASRTALPGVGFRRGHDPDARVLRPALGTRTMW